MCVCAHVCTRVCVCLCVCVCVCKSHKSNPYLLVVIVCKQCLPANRGNALTCRKQGES